MSSASERIILLRQQAIRQFPESWRSQENQLNWYRGWLENRAAESHLQRVAAAKAVMLRRATPVIDDGELLVGKPCYRKLEEKELAELANYELYTAPSLPPQDGQASHMAIDYPLLLSQGISGMGQRINQLRQRCDRSDPESLARDLFYQACLQALDGVIDYARHYADHAEQLAAAASGRRRQELLTMAAACRQVPEHPARTFYEALQSVHFITFCLEGLYQLGRPDRYLLPYYEADLAAGRLDPEQAQELIDCLCLLFNTYIPRGLAVGLMVGGSDPQGRDTTNQLSEMFLASIGHTRLSYPAIGLCVTQETPRHVLRQSCLLLAEGLSHPALFNDQVIRRGLKKYGLSEAESCEYIHSTCVEITPVASSAVWVASPYHNLVQLLLDLLETGRPRELQSYEALLAALRSRLRQAISRGVTEQNRLQMQREKSGGDPLVSCFVADCLEKGLDIDQGGARYNWIMPSFVGLANLADSLLVLKKTVYEDKRLTCGQWAELLKSNFRRDAALRQELLRKIPKYGNDDDQPDQIVQLLTGWISEETSRFRTWRQDRFIPSLFCWIMHEQLGQVTGATPDGRLAGFPLGDGSGPAQGREENGPTASILSSTKWPHEDFIGGIAVNLKFSRSSFRESAIDKIIALILTYMERGGFELQINVVDRQTLLEARKHPEAYRDLVVRVGGYSDYFIHLSAAMQDEVIARTEHGI